MLQIIQSFKKGIITLDEVPEPHCKAGGLMVRNVASVISTGTEKLMIEAGRKSLLGKARARPDLVRQAWAKAKKEGFFSVYKEAMNRLDEPIPLGYSAAGMVLEVGAGVSGYKPGDRVAIAGAGFASHAEVVWVPENLAVSIPDGVSYEAAAFVMLGAIALHGVRQAALTLGETAVVIGLGLLGLLSLQFLAAQGCRVIGVDLDPEKCRIAKQLGADLTLVPGEHEVEEAVANFTHGRGADGVILAAAAKDSRPLRLAEAIARERARLVLVGVADLRLTRKVFWNKELIFTVSKAGGPGSLETLYEAQGYDYPLSLVRWTERRNLQAFLSLVAQGRIQVEPLITHRFPIAKALQAYDLILGNREPYIGVLLTYPEIRPHSLSEAGARRMVLLKTPPTQQVTASRTAVGLIGGGKFTKNILLPAMRDLQGLKFVGVATTTGVTAQHLAKKFGFVYATTDYQEILADPAVGSVLITTQHHLHARLVLEALAVGKHVFVEKPLCLTWDEMAEIEAAYNGSRLLMVGFNRRFAPLAQQVKSTLLQRTTPLVMNYRVNAGYIPPDHWVHDPAVGGGRLVGEICHFIDFFHYMTDSEAVNVSVSPISGELGKYQANDNLCLTLSFRDGSVGSILYTAKGPKAFSRERFEVFCEDSLGVIEDFRRAVIVKGGHSRTIKKFSMDMGYKAELESFFQSESPIDFAGYAASSRATLKAAEALLSGKPVVIPMRKEFS